MPNSARDTVKNAEATAVGKALKRLRERAGMTQAQAAEALVPPTTPQTWQRYEAGERPNSLLRVDVLQRLAGAVGASYAELMDERDNVIGFPSGTPPPRSSTPAVQPEPSFTMPVWGRARAGAPSNLVIDPTSEPDATLDLGWMFGPNTIATRLAGDSMSPWAESGELVVADKTRWPRRGQACIIEKTTGELYVKFYEKSDGSTLFVKQLFPEETLAFPLAEIKGVYAVRFRGD